MGYFDEALEHSAGAWKKHKYIRKDGKKYIYKETQKNEDGAVWDKYQNEDTGETIKVNRTFKYDPDRYDTKDFADDTIGEEAEEKLASVFKKKDKDKYLVKHSDDYLEHHGIQGQKWGVRRFQNKDGSLTKLGKSRVVSKTNKKHHFENKDINHNTRKETVQALIASALSTAALTGANVATISAGFVIPHAVAATPLMAAATVYNAGKLISGDINNAKANKKEKQFKAEREKAPIDKKTGFHKKTREMSMEEDMERVNPLYKNWDDNTKNNCVLCTMTMELRRRGYDVQANKAVDGYAANTLVKDWYPNAKPKVSEGSYTNEELKTRIQQARNYQDPSMLKISKERQTKMIESTLKEVESQKEGARGQLTVMWDGSTSGHSMFYAKENGKMVIYDAQANKKYSNDKEITKLLKNTSQAVVTRLDNADLNAKYIKEVAT